jgi:uncharacterized protein (DUF58 family)
MWTRKGGLIVFLGVLSFFFGLIFADFQLVILAILIFTFFLLVAVMPKPAVTVNREVSNTSMFEADELKVRMKLKKVRPGFGTIEVFDRIPEYVVLKSGLNHIIYNPTPYETLEYQIKFPLRGYYSVGPTRVRTADHFNIFYSELEKQKKEPISIFPHARGLKELRFKSKKNIHYPGEFLTVQAGASTEFYHIREYIKGDPFKKINWKVYARKRELMINEYEKENICDTLIFLDARSINNIGSTTENTLEYSIRIALAVSNFLILRRNQVGIVVYNDRITMLPPKPGMRQLNEILSFLTGVYAKGWEEINSALDYAKPYLKSKTTVIIISNLEYDPSFLKAMQMLAALDFRVIIISPSSLDFELKATPTPYTGPQEKLELFRLGRKNFISELTNLGVAVLHYMPEDSVDEILEQISKEILR